MPVLRPPHAVDVSAGCHGETGHVATAPLATAVRDVPGGAADAEPLDGQAPVGAGLPGVRGTGDGPRATGRCGERRRPCGPGPGILPSGRSSSPAGQSGGDEEWV
ncbi:DUF6368 family protein [Streptomyces sp. NPDC058195]|uniref:DUF6368 family protein n=1 Tax=Streptomyces sp. NPDC058195 TaxID=3346375 RepID=UPI0036F014AF